METNNGRKTNLIIIAVLIVVVVGVLIWWQNSQAPAGQPAGTEVTPATSTGVAPTDNTQAIQGSLQNINVGNVDQELQSTNNDINSL